MATLMAMCEEEKRVKGSIIYMAWQEGIHRTPRIDSTRKENRDLSTTTLGYRCESYLSLRSDVGSEELSSSGGITANDVSWSLVLA